MEEKKTPKAKLALAKSLIETWELGGVPCRYVRFHQAVPRFQNDEPVSEFQLSDNRKYGVDSITYTDHGVIWRAKGELDICALANVMYARSGLK
jgi:hypothetical protein